MSDESGFTRREFVVAAISAGALTAVAPAAFAAPREPRNVPRLLVFDPEHADACRRIDDAQTNTCVTLPVTGDRVRFGQELFSSEKTPSVVAGLTHYADYILLSGCAAEHGYRVLSLDVQAQLVEWTVAKVRRSTSS